MTTVLVDAANFKPGQTGIRSYTSELVRELSARSDLTVDVITSDPQAFAAMNVRRTIPIDARTRGFVARVLWRERNLARLVRSSAADVVLVNTLEAPFRRLPVPLVVLLHDLGPLVASHLYGRAKWLRFAVDARRVCRIADHMVVVSQAALDDCVRRYGRLCHPITRIGSGPRRSAPVERRSGAWQGRVLYCGTADRNKNLEVLVRALGGPWGDLVPPTLTLTGPVTERRLASLRRVAVAAGVSDRFAHLGFVDERTLARLMGEADVFAFPSLHEGFGMPVTEAMSIGLPVLAADVPAVSEAAGGAAVLVAEPERPEAWGAALRRIAGDDTLRGELADRGIVRVEALSWSGVAARCADVLHGYGAREARVCVER